MLERLVQVDDKLFAILSNSELWLKPLNREKLQPIPPEITRVKAMAAGRQAS